jgi:uncharacterized protein YegL
MHDDTPETDWGIDRRTLLQRAAAGSAIGLVGVPALSGTGLATDDVRETCGDLDVVCAIDTSGSLSGSELDSLEVAVNRFVDELPTDGSVQVGSVEFGNGDVRNRNDLQAPSGLTVSLPGSGSGNTPMPAAIDVADQAVYGDAAARSDALKLVVLFTDGGPNYANTSYTEDYTAPRDDSANWSAVAGNGTYDGADTASSTVTESEMAETALVAGSAAEAAVGGGATMVATVYVGDDDTEAMTGDALAAYTDLPTYLSTQVASASGLAIDADLSNVDALVDDLVALLFEVCCTPCPSGFWYKYEWVEDDHADGDCAGSFVVYDADDERVGDVDGIDLVSVTCDEDGEPQEACFETSLCAVDYRVKAGRETESATVTYDDAGGTVCVTGIETTNPAGRSRTHAISHVVFSCPETSE